MKRLTALTFALGFALGFAIFASAAQATTYEYRVGSVIDYTTAEPLINVARVSPGCNIKTPVRVGGLYSLSVVMKAQNPHAYPVHARVFGGDSGYCSGAVSSCPPFHASFAVKKLDGSVLWTIDAEGAAGEGTFPANATTTRQLGQAIELQRSYIDQPTWLSAEQANEIFKGPGRFTTLQLAATTTDLHNLSMDMSSVSITLIAPSAATLEFVIECQ